MVPDHLMLPADDGSGGDSAVVDNAGVVVCSIDGRWIVRGSAVAFTAEAGLARQVLGERDYQVVEDRPAVESLLARGSGHVPIDLLQYEFARREDARTAGPGRRRLALMALALLLSPVVLVLAESLRYEMAQRALFRQAEAIAVPLVAAEASGDPVTALQTRQRALDVPYTMDDLRRSLFQAVAVTAGTRLDAFEYADTDASATVVHATPAQLQDLRASLEQAGIRSRDDGSTQVADGLRTRLLFETRP